jgi:hypothetical protein
MGLGYGEIDRIAAVVHNTSREYVREYAWVFAKKSDLNIGSTPGCYGNMISVTVTIASIEGSRRLTFCSAPISTEQTLERFMQNLFGQFRARARHSVILAQQPPRFVLRRLSGSDLSITILRAYSTRLNHSFGTASSPVTVHACECSPAHPGT